MKTKTTKLKLFGFIAAFAIITIGSVALSLSLTSCDNGSGGDPELPGTITISPDTDVAVGDTLTVSYSGTETVSYQWKMGSTNLGTATTQVANEAGSYTVTVSADGFKPKTSAAVTVSPKVAMPTANPPAGAVASGTTVTLSSATAGADIWYTTGNSAPAKNGTGSTKYASPITITAAVTIKAIAVKDDMTDSNVLTAAYTISSGGNPNLNTAALTAKIAEADEAKDDVTEATNAAGAPAGQKWATAAQLKTLTDAMSAAETALETATTQAAIDSAVTTLNNALNAFNTAVENNGTGTATGPVAVNHKEIEGVSVPATGGTPVAAITETVQFTGTVAWNPAISGAFAADTAYTATITLTAKTGFTLQGVTADFFEVAGAETVSNPANSGVITAVFPKTAAAAVPVITIDTQPETSTTVEAGSVTGSLSVSASVTLSATLSYQWYSNDSDSNEGGSLIDDATGATFTIPTTLEADTYYYYCVVSATGATSVPSSVATVIVSAPPAGPDLSLYTGSSATGTPLETYTADDAADAFTYITGNPAEYTLQLGTNIALFDVNDEPRTITLAANVKLTLVGNGGPRTLSGVRFTLNGAGSALTLGNNITLGGFEDFGNVRLIYVQNGSLTILAGSKITGYTGANYTVMASGANASITMSGGEITGNHSMGTIPIAGGVYIGSGASFTMSGGSITGNTNQFNGNNANPADVTISRTTPAVDSPFTLSGSATIGTLSLDAPYVATATKIIASSWTGSLTKLHLCSLNAGLADIPEMWANKTIISGGSTANISMLNTALGEFRADGAQAIPSTATINSSGVLEVPTITITTQPAATITVNSGSISGNLRVVASVSPTAALTYQWYSNTTNSSTGGTAVATGGTNATFTIPTTLTRGTYYYFCEVGSAGAASVRSNVATVIVESVWTRISGAGGATCIATDGNGKWVIGSSISTYNCDIKTSTDNGMTWTTVVTGTNMGIQGVAYGNGRWIAVGQRSTTSGAAMTSTDGTNWTDISSSITLNAADVNAFRDVAYGNGRWVAVGTGGSWAEARMVTSTDGTTWTQVTLDLSNYTGLYCVGYLNFRWLAAGRGGIMVTSADGGTTWTRVDNSSFDANTYIQGLTYGNGRWIAVGTSGKMAYSTNGTTWTAIPAGTGAGQSGFASTRSINAIAWSGTLFVAVGASGTASTSTNGTTWTMVDNSSFNTSDIQGLTYDNGRFIATSSSNMAYLDW